MNDNRIEIIKDDFQEVKFWAELLNNDKLNKETVESVNKGLQKAIDKYLYIPGVLEKSKGSKL